MVGGEAKVRGQGAQLGDCGLLNVFDFFRRRRRQVEGDQVFLSFSFSLSSFFLSLSLPSKKNYLTSLPPGGFCRAGALSARTCCGLG